MNKLYFLLLLFLPVTGQLFAQAVPEVLFYQFEESGTSVANEASAPPPGTATATIMGGVTQGGSNLCNATLIGSGISSSTDYLNTGWSPNLGAGSWSISFRTANITPSSTLFYIFGDVNTNSFRCFTNGVAGPNNWIIRGAGLTDTYINGGAVTAATMTTFVYDATMAQMRGYLDGVLVTTVAQGAVNLTGTGPLKVMGYSTNVGAPAGGNLDDFRFYSHALTQAEIDTIYNPFLGNNFLGTDFATCESAPDFITTSSTGSHTWNTGSTNDTIVPDTSGVYIVNVSGICGSGTDSVTVTMIPSTYDTIATISCGDYTAPSGAIYTIDGVYSDTISNAMGCDSIININLTIASPTSSSMTQSSCGDYTAPSGAVFTMSGTFNDTIPNMMGCDSVITIDLTVNMPSASSMTVTSCGDYTAPSGAVFSSSGTVQDIIPNAVGCDSVITIDLTVNQPSTSTLTTTSCGDYTAPDGAVYSTSGTYLAILTNSVGCDSTITINLTVVTVDDGIGYNGNGELEAAQNGATYQWIDCLNGNANVPGETSQVLGTSATGTYAVEVTMNGCTVTSACMQNMVGINELTANGYSFYPNPVSSTLMIENTSNEPTFYTLVSNTGAVVMTFESGDAKMTVDMSKVVPGVYYLTTQSSAGKSVHKIVRN